MFASKNYVDNNLNSVKTTVLQNSASISSLEETVSGINVSVEKNSSDISSLQNSVSGLTEEIVNILYPVGIVVSVISSSSPPFISYGTWEQVGQGRVLWGADSSHSVGTTIEAGLPNIQGSLQANGAVTVIVNPNFANNAFYSEGPTADAPYGQSNYYTNDTSVYFNANKSNSIYGNSTTVQPPALVVKFYKRIA